MDASDCHSQPTTKIWESSKFRDNRYTVLHINELVAHGCSCRKACGIEEILAMYNHRWKMLVAKVYDMNSAVEFMSQNTTGGARKIHSGQKSCLFQVEPELKQFIFQLREQGIQLTNQMVVQDAARLLPAFEEKATQAKELAVHHFKCCVGLTQCLATHMAQKYFSEMEAGVKDIITMMKEKVPGRNPDDVLNMDQTPIPYSYNSNNTLDIKDTKTIHAMASTTNTMCVTLAATVTASGKMLRPFLIFKEKQNGCIVMR